MRMLSIRIRNWCVSWAYASGTDANAEHTRQELMRMLSISISFPIFQRPFVIEVPTNHAEHMCKELVRMLCIRISSLRVCSACASETKCGLAPSKIKIIGLYFYHQITYPGRFYGVKIRKIRAMEYLTLGHLFAWWSKDPDPGGPKTYGSGFATLAHTDWKLCIPHCIVLSTTHSAAWICGRWEWSFPSVSQ